jgi:hypothetical protein
MDDYYFKDDLTFNVRHSNVILYKRLKELIDVKDLFKLPIIDRLYSRSKSALTKIVDSSHKRFGDPKFSFQSYFDYLDTGKDWFEENDIVKYTAIFELKDDNLMIENREFGPIVASIMNDMKIPVDDYSPTIKGMKQFNETFILEKKANNLQNKIYNKNTSRYTKKCPSGKIRDSTFKCTKKKVN